MKNLSAVASADRSGWNYRSGNTDISPRLSLEWQHEFLTSGSSITSGFANGAGGPFTVQSPNIGRDSAIIGATIDFTFSETFGANLGYEAELGRDNYSRHSIHGGLRWSF